MAKPVIWTVDDDPDVLRAVERDLRRHYGDRYKVISADSGLSALEATKQLKLRNEPVALFLVDQRMPRMSGVEFLEKAIELYPDAKRALLTAYADTDAAIRAINNAHIDHYLMKPWDPPEEDQIAATKNIDVRLNSSVIAVEGADRCETVTVQNSQTRATEKVSASALLIYAGAVPHTD